jgi:hypothetical protein
MKESWDYVIKSYNERRREAMRMQEKKIARGQINSLKRIEDVRKR